MPSSSSRSRVPVRRSPRPAPRGTAGLAAQERPLAVPVAVVFGVLAAGESAYLAWLLWDLGAGWGWFTAVPVLLALVTLAGAAGTFLGRRLAWVPLAVSAALTLLGVLALAVLFALLGGGRATWAAVLMLVGPGGALVLSLSPPVRTWSGGGRARRPAGGRRRAGSAR